MMYGGSGFGGAGSMGYLGWLMPLIGLLFLTVLVVALVLIIRSLAAQNDKPRSPDAGTEPRHRAVDVLDERYARGEIDRDEFLEKKKDLST